MRDKLDTQATCLQFLSVYRDHAEEGYDEAQIEADYYAQQCLNPPKPQADLSQ